MVPDDETVRVMHGWGLRRSLNPTLGEHYGWSGSATVDGKHRFVSVLPIPDLYSEYDEDVIFCASYVVDAYRIGPDQRSKAYASDPIAAMTALLMGVRD